MGKVENKEKVENFLEDHTFICTVFNARMSDKQCMYQCARSKQEVSDYIVDYFSDKDMEVPTKYNECLHCPKFHQPKASTIKKLSDRAKRFKNTPGGTARMRVEAYLEARKNLEAREEE
jgi:hypothetical protein